jgi:predicted dehydrogenase
VSEPLRVGVVGAGIGAGYIAGFQKQPGVQVHAICARTTNRLQPLVEKYHIPRAYTDYEAMLAREPLDIVVVATPNYLHHPMTLAALNAGKHVLCDKPLALNVMQAREMVDRAEQTGRKHFVPFIWRFVPAAAYVKELIASGFLGESYHANVRYSVRAWGDPQGPMRWQYDKAQAGSGALSNIGSHAIHLIQWWLGEIGRVCALLKTDIHERAWPDGARVRVEVEDTCAFLAELENGVPVVFDLSHVALMHRVFMEIGVYGREGALVFHDDWGESDAHLGRLYAIRRNDHEPTVVPIPERLTGEYLDMPDYYTPLRGCFSRMTREFVNAIREDRPAAPNFYDGLRVQRVIDAVLRSAEEERWVPVQEPLQVPQTS